MRGPGGLSRGAPVTHRPGLPPGPERWPPRTASSSGRGAPSCRGGEPRTLRGVGIGPRAFHILIPESRGPGAPPEAGGLESGWPSLEQLSLRGAWPAWVWGAGWGLRRGTSAGRCPGTGCGDSGVGGVAAVSLALEDHLHHRFRLSTELLRGHRQHGWLLAWGVALGLGPPLNSPGVPVG